MFFQRQRSGDICVVLVTVELGDDISVDLVSISGASRPHVLPLIDEHTFFDLLVSVFHGQLHSRSAC